MHLTVLCQYARGVAHHDVAADQVATLARQAGSLFNDGERFRAGERTSSSLAVSTVNAVVGKRLAKRQQCDGSGAAHTCGRSEAPLNPDALSLDRNPAI